MKKSAKHTLATIFAVVLTAICIIIELSLRFTEPFSPAAYGYIQTLIQHHPFVFGSFWIIILVSVVYVAYRKYSEKRTTTKLVVLLVWLGIFLTGLAYGLCQLF